MTTGTESGPETERDCQRLLECVAHLESLLARTDVGVYSVSADLGAVLYINAATLAIFGRPAEDFRRSPGLWLEAIDPRDVPFVGDPLTDLRRDGVARHCYRVVRPDGATVWVLDQSHRVDGPPARFDCLFTDITRRMEVERKLRDSQERFQRLAETAPVAITVVSATGEPIYSNEHTRTLHGRPIEELSRDAWLEMIHPEDRAALAAAVKTDGTWAGEYRVLLPNGEVRWIAGNRVPLRNGSGAVYAYLGTGVDITQRCVAEQAHRASEAELLALIESSEDIIFSFDSELRFLTFNAATSEYLRRTFGVELRKGLTIEEAFPPERAQRWRQMAEQTLREGRLALDFQRHDGRYVALTLNAIMRAGNPIGVSVFTKDIEDRRRAELTLRTLPSIVMRAQEDERRMIVHELHDGVLQDLNALKLVVQARKEAADSCELDRAVVASRIDDIIRTVRQLSLHLRPSTLDDLGLLPTIRSFAQRIETETGVPIFVSAEALGERIESDVETAGFRIVQEAVANACRHAQAKTVYVRIAREQDALLISVDDDGVGFDVDAGRERAVKAGHFGISVMEERAAALLGALSIRSAPDHGTTVSARIPLRCPRP